MDSTRLLLIPVAVFGAAIGSFLNVVVYRLPRGLSIMDPKWSFCPHCRQRIRPRDNIPIVAWLRLGGRCRACRGRIAVTYPIVECATALLFVTVWDAMFTAGLVPGLQRPGQDWPIVLAYLTLYGAMLAGSAMDLESYVIDIRVCLFATAVGFVGHGVWGLRELPGVALSAGPAATLPPAICLILLAMGGAWAATLLVSRTLVRSPPVENPPNAPNDADMEPAAGNAENAASPPDIQGGTSDSSRTAVVLLVVLTAVLFVWQLMAADVGLPMRLPPGGQRGLLACAVFMLLLIFASMVSRESDRQIIEDIEAERETARSMVLGEFAWLLPAVLVGTLLLVALRLSGYLAAEWPSAVNAMRAMGWLAPHLAGLGQAVAAAILSAAAGWTVRILGTLAFGKEAFGTGDIYIMAAIGSVAGFWALLFAFFLAAVLALIGVLATMARKTSRAVPFGPWLALGALAALWLQKPLLHFCRPAGSLLWSIITGRPLMI